MGGGTKYPPGVAGDSLYLGLDASVQVSMDFNIH